MLRLSLLLDLLAAWSAQCHGINLHLHFHISHERSSVSVHTADEIRYFPSLFFLLLFIFFSLLTSDCSSDLLCLPPHFPTNSGWGEEHHGQIKTTDTGTSAAFLARRWIGAKQLHLSLLVLFQTLSSYLSLYFRYLLSLSQFEMSFSPQHHTALYALCTM